MLTTQRALRSIPKHLWPIVVGMLGLVGSVHSQVLGYSLTLIPADPSTLEPVVARITNAQSCSVDPQSLRIHQVAATIFINILPKGDGCVPTGGNPTHDVLIGRFPPGTFNVALFLADTQLGVQQFTVIDSYPTKAGPFPLVDYTDHWWNPQELGWGISIMQHTSDRIFAVWFVYDQAGQPVWYTLQPGQWTYSFPVAVYTGPIYKTTGPYFGGPFDVSKMAIAQVGSGTFTFTDSNTGTFSYTVEGISDTKPITRLFF